MLDASEMKRNPDIKNATRTETSSAMTGLVATILRAGAVVAKDLVAPLRALGREVLSMVAAVTDEVHDLEDGGKEERRMARSRQRSSARPMGHGPSHSE